VETVCRGGQGPPRAVAPKKRKNNFTYGRNLCQLRGYIELLTDSYENGLLYERQEVLLTSVRFRTHVTYTFK
jgi:hypothetical protein